MNIKFTETFEIEVVERYDEKTDIWDSTLETINEGEICDVDILDERKLFVDVQFGNGSVIYGLPKSCFVKLD